MGTLDSYMFLCLSLQSKGKLTKKIIWVRHTKPHTHSHPTPTHKHKNLLLLVNLVVFTNSTISTQKRVARNSFGRFPYFFYRCAIAYIMFSNEYYKWTQFNMFDILTLASKKLESDSDVGFPSLWFYSHILSHNCCIEIVSNR